MFTLWLILACAEPPAPVDPLPETGVLRYELAWTGAADTLADGTPVRWADGWVMSHRMQLRACYEASALDLLLPPAFAGHDGDTLTATNLDAPTQEPLGQRGAVFGNLLAEGRWCAGDYVVSPDDTASETPDPSGGLSFYAHFFVPGRAGEGERELRLSATAEYSTLGGLTDPAGEGVVVDLDAASVRVTAVRDLSRLFDGVAAADLSDPDLGTELLFNLVIATTLVAEPLD